MPIVDYVPFNLRRFTTEPCSEERRAAIVEAMAQALSTFLSIRCSAYVERGRWATNLMADPVGSKRGTNEREVGLPR